VFVSAEYADVVALSLKSHGKNEGAVNERQKAAVFLGWRQARIVEDVNQVCAKGLSERC